MRAMMGMPARQSLPLFRQAHELTESVEVLAAESRELFFAILDGAPAPLLPGVRQLLQRLEHKGMPRGIATSSSSAYVRQILAPHGLLDAFSFILTADDVREGKPAPEIYEKAAARFGHAATEMVVLEDSPNGLRAAKAAGARCVVVPHALVPIRELEGADAILGSLEEARLGELLGL
jgi:HAD superfamily hydrolase (TIGR01509 family)